MPTIEEIKQTVETIAADARKASRRLAALTSDQKNLAIVAMATRLREHKQTILAANAKDMAAGASTLSSAMLDRLMLDEKRIDAIADDLDYIATLSDPVGEISEMTLRPNGLRVGRMRVPLGVVGVIYESRPNVTADTAALCLKAGNAVILRGGSEAAHSNEAIADLLGDALEAEGAPRQAIQRLPFSDREGVLHLLKQDRYVDLIVPRGGYGLIRFVAENSLIPVVKHDKGVCHIYIDREADLAMGVKIAVNAKASRPSVCNALETLLVHRAVAEAYLPMVAEPMGKAGVELRGCAVTKAILPEIATATDADWDEEYGALILAVKVVDSFEGAADHIAAHSSGHSEGIVTESHRTAMRFLAEIDSAAVMVNASTRFNDGGQFGLGAEVGISTQKLHARGPMGIVDLTCRKWIVFGDGQIRE